jgi:hypothetical protein
MPRAAAGYNDLEHALKETQARHIVSVETIAHAACGFICKRCDNDTDHFGGAMDVESRRGSLYNAAHDGERE